MESNSDSNTTWGSKLEKLLDEPDDNDTEEVNSTRETKIAKIEQEVKDHSSTSTTWGSKLEKLMEELDDNDTEVDGPGPPGSTSSSTTTWGSKLEKLLEIDANDTEVDGPNTRETKIAKIEQERDADDIEEVNKNHSSTSTTWGSKLEKLMDELDTNDTDDEVNGPSNRSATTSTTTWGSKLEKLLAEPEANDTEVDGPSTSTSWDTKLDTLMQEPDANDTEEVDSTSTTSSSTTSWDTKLDKLMRELDANDTKEVNNTRSEESILQDIYALLQEPFNFSFKSLVEVEKEEYAAQNQECAEAAISFLNASCKNAEGGTEYELVEPVSSLSFVTTSRGLHYHANFKAKSKNDPEAKPLLFFVELVIEKPEPQVTLCTCLGPSDSESAATGLNGCEVCSKIQIHHPKSGAFAVSGIRLHDVHNEEVA
ncbi:suppressor protein SRP40-like [Beta vulgaris subsp. vulgaris]|uniref:suppressor protein SRP40-like n=1 Tax=Beta vulgaris subsp. vulgaris TaxID=3555 RepID=UPI0025472D70|nr:suppressor protein SRP40-like [Beta vulgaris subsp. vulgaris]